MRQHRTQHAKPPYQSLTDQPSGERAGEWKGEREKEREREREKERKLSRQQQSSEQAGIDTLLLLLLLCLGDYERASQLCSGPELHCVMVSRMPDGIPYAYLHALSPTVDPILMFVSLRPMLA